METRSFNEAWTLFTKFPICNMGFSPGISAYNMGFFLVAGGAHQDEGRSAFTSKTQLQCMLPEPSGGMEHHEGERALGFYLAAIASVRIAVTFS